ncbi:hypothetical protein KJ972_03030, partial [Candidatus Micrarchaeota archaeon]|nr:hypothetical protein [Candidatus Micrarchaeota archaeon]
LILAETQSSGELIGGEQSISISIIEAPIILDLDSPKESTLLALEKTVFRIKASYANGAFLQGGAAVLFLDGKEISMKKKENGFFEASYTFSAEETDLQHVSVQVSDAIGNHGTLEQDFFVVADIRVQFFALLPILVVLVILAVLVTWLVIPRIRVRKTTESTQKRKMELEQELVSLQKQYFEQNAISKQTLSKKSFELNKELTELNKKLNTSTK